MRIHIHFICIFLFQLTAQANLLWHATRGDLSIHLLATTPFVSSGMPAHLNSHVSDALENAVVVAFPASPDQHHESEASNLLGQHGVYTEGENLSQFLPPKLNRKFNEVCEELKIPSANLRRLKPWLAARSLQQLATIRANVQLADRLDRHMYQAAIRAGKDLAYLSKPRDVLEFYLNLDDETHLQILEMTLDRARLLPEYFAAAESAWRISDVDAATRLVNNAYHNYPHLREKMLSARSQLWANQLMALASVNSNVLAVIDLEFLVGEGNVLEYLAADGFTIVASSGPR